jgi:hypothetical protein
MSMRYQAGIVLPGYNPLKVPNAPTIGTATTSSTTSLTIAFTAPSDVGGGAITSYIATAKRTSDGVLFSASGASSPITITGLTAVFFTVTVIAVNVYGPSPTSAASNSVTLALPAIGSALGGGYFAGQISTAGNGIADYNLVVGPVASAQADAKWKTSNTSGDPTSVIDGPGNTATMNSATYPAAQFCADLVTGGFSDWYMPALNELDIVYFGLKPTTQSNSTAVGINANSVPKRTSNYSTGTPAQTSATAFQSGGAEAFNANYWWASTQKTTFPGDISGYILFFGTGNLAGGYKTQVFPVRAIRRVAV